MYYMMPMRGLGTADDVLLEENAAIPADDILVDELLPDEPTEPVVSSEGGAITREDVSSDRWMVPSSLATQIFSVVPGLAGGLAGFVLASKLSNAKSVKASEVLLASGSVALITFMSVFLVRTIEEYD